MQKEGVRIWAGRKGQRKKWHDTFGTFGTFYLFDSFASYWKYQNVNNWPQNRTHFWLFERKCQKCQKCQCKFLYKRHGMSGNGRWKFSQWWDKNAQCKFYKKWCEKCENSQNYHNSQYKFLYKRQNRKRIFYICPEFPPRWCFTFDFCGILLKRLEVTSIEFVNVN